METIEKKRQLKKLAIRQIILDTAKEIAAKEGWQQLTIRKICTQINYSAPIVYQHFESKEMILNCIREEGMTEMQAKIEQLQSKITEPSKQLVAYALAFWHFSVAHPEIYQVMFNLQGAICKNEAKSSPVDHIHHCYKVAIKKLNTKANTSNKELLSLLDYYIAIIHGFIALNMVKKIKSGVDKGEQVFNMSLKHFVHAIKDAEQHKGKKNSKLTKNK